jgi:hypothetical protein
MGNGFIFPYQNHTYSATIGPIETFGARHNRLVCLFNHDTRAENRNDEKRGKCGNSRKVVLMPRTRENRWNKDWF